MSAEFNAEDVAKAVASYFYTRGFISIVHDERVVSTIAGALQHVYDLGKACGESESIKLRVVLCAAVAVDKSPGYREYEALREALKAMAASC